jgi:hypothetical protein
MAGIIMTPLQQLIEASTGKLIKKAQRLTGEIKAYTNAPRINVPGVSKDMKNLRKKSFKLQKSLIRKWNRKRRRGSS